MFNHIITANWPNYSVKPPVFGTLRDSHDNEDAFSYQGVSHLLKRNPVRALFSTIIVVLLLLNLKSLPGIWHMRIVNAFRFIIKTLRPETPFTHDNVFQSLVTTSSAPLLEIDFNLHKTNSTYFADLDISRTHLVCTLFGKGIGKLRGGTCAYAGSGHPPFGLALGAVSCTFRREITPYEPYEMWSRVLSWDEKWFYIMTHFTSKGFGQQYTHTSPLVEDEDHNETVFATAISKCVFKSGRKTVSPEIMFAESELLPSPKDEDAKDALCAVESQRQTGLDVSHNFTTQTHAELEGAFKRSIETNGILARHVDGSGIRGVVTTLLQLAGLTSHSAI